MTLTERALVAIRPGRAFYWSALGQSIAIAALFVLQLHIVLPVEDNEWPLTILSLINLVAAGGLALTAGFMHEGEVGVKRLLWAVGAVFIAGPIFQVLLPDTAIDYQDWSVFTAWVLAFAMLSIILILEKASPIIQTLFIAGLTVQASAILGDFGFDDFFRPDIRVDPMDWVYATGTALSTLSYLLGFQLFVAANARHFDGYDRFVLWAHKRAYRGLGRFVSIALEEIRFAHWKLKNPSATFADYYAGSIASRIKRGGSHRTLGQRRYFTKDIRTKTQQQRQGRRQFGVLLEIGLRPDQLCVDYGCGSLRVGQHAMRYLSSNRYLGMDIVDTFFKEGLKLLTAAETGKKPMFRVITEFSLEEARAAKPDFIYCIAVVKHIPPNELAAFFESITSMMTPTTTLALNFEVGENGRRQGAKNWTYSREYMVERLLARRPGARIRPSPGQQNRKEYLVVDGYDQIA